MFQMIDYISVERAKNGGVQPHVSLRCSCSKFSVTRVPLDKFSEITDNYAVLNPGEYIKCESCGNVQTSDDGRIELENQHSGNLPPIVKCPKCGSADVRKVTPVQRVVMYAVYSPKYLSQYECKRCFNKF